ncbi:prephenate dehydrogenase/arogenate dehydrogenase family protein [Anaerocolumna sedimenticola]|uniref:Prephenate dehydrogenase n=1 Tax=Anaerocolumna sedimenticola TaxID=2696063 RepID=A0A6P1TL88_9FIRM|nr:prephenate dehydrogenase [Anaerocolumna sedimenticola]QHQ61814.1 prephenate dehydrogenase/arogenate dehydrogenase family protein [Anaerocolumna sedimenticola]
MNDSIVGFIGFGLIGGSIARALKEINPGNTLIAFNYNINKLGNGLKEALDDKVLDHITYDLNDRFPTCDIIFLCAPVLSNITYLTNLKNMIKPDCIVTDVGSVKGNIHKTVSELGLEHQFIGGHPMAGSEKTGYQNSHSKLLENAYYILTPTEKTPQDKLHKLYEIVSEIGAIPLILEPKEHDNITAAISHVPHIIASGLVNLVKESDDTAEKMRTLAAGGFKDITRIASSSPVMWQNICLTNTESISNVLNQYIACLQDMRNALERKDEDYIYRFFDTASEYRDSIPNKSIGMMKKVFEIYLDIIDEAGAIATIATLLATNRISIKNIGIIHNREFEQGVLRIEFYEEEASVLAVELLKKYRYTVYER